MKQAALVTVGAEGRLAELLAEWAKERSLAHRAVRHMRAALNLVRKNVAAVVVLKLGRDLERELTLLERVSALYPTTPCLIVGDADNPDLAALCWDLGARYVLFPPTPIEKLTSLLPGFFPSPAAPPGSQP